MLLVVSGGVCVKTKLIYPPTITSDRFASPNAPGLPAAPSKPKLPHSGGHTAEIRSEIAPEMAENSNNSNDNGSEFTPGLDFFGIFW